MTKIYRRPTLSSGNGSKRKRNEKNRTRNTIMNFRVTAGEKELIEARQSVTGLTKAEFLIQSCLYQTILVKGNIKSFALIERRLSEIAEVIDHNPDLEELDPVHAEALKTILEIIDRRFGKDKKNGVENT